MDRADIKAWYKGICGVFLKPCNRETQDAYAESLIGLNDHTLLGDLLSEAMDGEKIPTLRELKDLYWHRKRGSSTFSNTAPTWGQMTSKLLTWEYYGWYWRGPSRCYSEPVLPKESEEETLRHWTRDPTRATLQLSRPFGDGVRHAFLRMGQGPQPNSIIVDCVPPLTDSDRVLYEELTGFEWEREPMVAVF